MGPGPAPPSLTTSDTGSHIVRAGHKRYFFDLGSNNKGQYLRITEVRPVSSLGCLLLAVPTLQACQRGFWLGPSSRHARVAA